MVFETDRLILREYFMEDFDAFFEILFLMLMLLHVKSGRK